MEFKSFTAVTGRKHSHLGCHIAPKTFPMQVKEKKRAAQKDANITTPSVTITSNYNNLLPLIDQIWQTNTNKQRPIRPSEHQQVNA